MAMDKLFYSLIALFYLNLRLTIWAFGLVLIPTLSPGLATLSFQISFHMTSFAASGIQKIKFEKNRRTEKQKHIKTHQCL